MFQKFKSLWQVSAITDVLKFGRNVAAVVGIAAVTAKASSRSIDLFDLGWNAVWLYRDPLFVVAMCVLTYYCAVNRVLEE